MKRVWLVLFLGLSNPQMARAEDFLIRSFDHQGHLSFSEVDNTASYQIEWAPNPEGPWTNFSESGVGWLNRISPAGTGAMAVPVPGAYRVVATPSHYLVIDGDHLNGSFESGVLGPWGGGSVVSNVHFAADGAWYAQVVATVSRAEIYQFFPSVTTSMPVFALSFQVRNGSPGFSSASGSLSAGRQDGSFINAVVTNSSISPLTDVEWSLHTYTFQFTEVWDMSQNMKVGILFNGGTPGAVGFADHVVLEQVREASGLPLPHPPLPPRQHVPDPLQADPVDPKKAAN